MTDFAATSAASVPIPPKRYEAIFRSGNLQLEKESDNLAEIKSWIAGFLKDYPSPDLMRITDTVEHGVIFEEDNTK